MTDTMIQVGFTHRLRADKLAHGVLVGKIEKAQAENTHKKVGYVDIASKMSLGLSLLQGKLQRGYDGRFLPRQFELVGDFPFVEILVADHSYKIDV